MELTLQVLLNARNSVLPENKEKLKSINEFYRIKGDQNIIKKIADLMNASFRLIQLIK